MKLAKKAGCACGQLLWRHLLITQFCWNLVEGSPAVERVKRLRPHDNCWKNTVLRLTQPATASSKRQRCEAESYLHSVLRNRRTWAAQIPSKTFSFCSGLLLDRHTQNRLDRYFHCYCKVLPKDGKKMDGADLNMFLGCITRAVFTFPRWWQIGVCLGWQWHACRHDVVSACSVAGKR